MFLIDWLNGKFIILLVFLFILFSCQKRNNTNIDQVAKDDIVELPYFINNEKDTIISQIFNLRNNCTLFTFPCKQNTDEILFCIRYKGETIDTIIGLYDNCLDFDKRNSLFYNIYDFDHCFAITEKVGSNLYVSVYEKKTCQQIISDAIPYNLDTIHQIILYIEPLDVSKNDYSNPLVNQEDVDFSIYDVRKNRKTFAVNPFSECRDPYYGSLGAFSDIKITDVTNTYMYLVYNKCRYTIKR